MARVSKQFLEAYKPLSTKELKDPVIFVVDMIEGFVHEGALHDEEINAATVHIEALIQSNGLFSLRTPIRQRRVNLIPTPLIASSVRRKVRLFRNYSRMCRS